MIILLYTFIIFASGLSLALMIAPQSRWIRLALACPLGLFLSALPLYLMNLCHIDWSRERFLMSFACLHFTLIVSKRTALWNFIKILWIKFGAYNRLEKILLICLFLGFLGMLMRLMNNPLWSGDTYMHWGPKAIHWIEQGGIRYTPAMEKQMQLWISYPLLHSLALVVNLYTLPQYPAFSIKFFDFFAITGLFFSFCAFFSLFLKRSQLILLCAFTALFTQKQLLNYLISGYADPWIALYYFLGFTLVLHAYENRQSPRFMARSLFAAGLIWGLMVITKNEGTVRLGIFFFVSLLFFHRSIWEHKKTSLLLALQLFLPLILLRLFDFSNRPVNYFVDYYYNSFRSDSAYLLQRLPLIAKASLLSMHPQGLLKSFWPVSALLLIIFLLRKKNIFQKKLLFFTLTLFCCNWIFNHIPSWVGDANTSAQALADEILIRLNIQITSLLAAAVVLQSIFFLKSSTQDFMQESDFSISKHSEK